MTAKTGQQTEVIDFLRTHDAFAASDPVKHIETHGSHVFLCGDVALKIKRDVRYAYMDLSNADLRHQLLKKELLINQKNAPMIYRDVVPITRGADGKLHLDGIGPAVEWALRMHRFSEQCEMTAMADSGQLSDRIAESLGQTIATFHQDCTVGQAPGDQLMHDILDELAKEFAPFRATLHADLVDGFLKAARQSVLLNTTVLRDRSEKGHVRRVHGDLHLRNLLFIDGKPVLFDALEFDERLATCDVLYDLAFLLMDLCHRGLSRQANIVMNAYLFCARGAADPGLMVLPLFLAVRAAIRAMVAMQTDQTSGHSAALVSEAQRYLSQAIASLQPAQPVLIAIGGPSGTGKTVLARTLAQRVLPCPGAVHLRTDTERKVGAGTVGYDAAARTAVYERMFMRAEAVLSAGRSVVLDATFLDPTQRTAAQSLAGRLSVAFHGRWLMAPLQILTDRVAHRHDDASDADGAVVRTQMAALAAGPSPDKTCWPPVDASKTPETTFAKAQSGLGHILDQTAR